MTPRTRLLVAVALAASFLLVGSVRLRHESPPSRITPVAPEVVYGRLAAGSSAGVNLTNASATVVGTLLSTLSTVLYLNNTNSSGAYSLRLAVDGVSGLANLVSAEVGIETAGGARTPMIKVSLGGVTQSTGSFVTVAGGTSARIYVSLTVSAAGLLSTINFHTIVADDSTEAAYMRMKGRIAVT
jgi:hypothetical protein